MIPATTSTAHSLCERTLPLYRIGPRTLSALIGIEIVLLAVTLVWTLTSVTPSVTPLAKRADLTPVVEAIHDRLNGAVADPLIPLGDGQSARASNLRGFMFNNNIYYYYIEGARNFDPLSRGVIRRDQVEVLLRDESGRQTVVIYRVL